MSEELFEGEPKEQWRKDMDAGLILDSASGSPAPEAPTPEDTCSRCGIRESQHRLEAHDFLSTLYPEPERPVAALPPEIVTALDEAKRAASWNVEAEVDAAFAALTAAITRALHDATAEAYRAHAASFGALQKVSMLTDLQGEVDDYSEVPRAVERALQRRHAGCGTGDAGEGMADAEPYPVSRGYMARVRAELGVPEHEPLLHWAQQQNASRAAKTTGARSKCS